MRVRENYEMETLEMLIDLNNRMYFAKNKIKNGEPMEPIPKYEELEKRLAIKHIDDIFRTQNIIAYSVGIVSDSK